MGFSDMISSLLLTFIKIKVRKADYNGIDLGPLRTDPNKRANATFVILVRNEEMWSMMSAIQRLEARFNKKYGYPYVFLNNVPFTDSFKDSIRRVVSTKVEFGLVPKEHWSIPEWIDVDRAHRAWDDMYWNNVLHGESESYRHMCRFFSGFFFRHPLLLKYEYYWRVEPGVNYMCDFDFDPFVYMQEHKKLYSFVISFDEIPETVPTLYQTVRDYMHERKLQPTWFDFFKHTSDTGDKVDEFNLCHFWSNFEIGDLRFFRSQQYLDFFDYLDRKGGFFYERWGDAPIHSFAVGMFLKKSEVQFFNDIGYFHAPNGHCPVGEPAAKCHCDEEAGGFFMDFDSRDCVPSWVELQPERSEAFIPGFFDRTDLNVTQAL
jgi:alpha 1,2-mannosyltransferase